MIARPVGWLSVVASAGVGLQLVMGLIGADTGRTRTTAAIPVANSLATAPVQDASTDFGPAIDGSRVEGEFKCIDCHLSEYRAWAESPHFRQGFMRLRTTPAAVADYADSMGLTAEEVTTSGACIQCHGTPYENEWSNATLLTSVTCEACHNPSGGADGWLNIHAAYGANGVPRELESDAHRQMRVERCLSSGQLRSSDIYGLIKRCADCHLPKNEQLFEAGHEQKNIDFDVAALLGSVRHNFHMDQSSNEMVSSLWLNPVGGDGSARTVDGRLRLYAVLMPLIAAEVGVNNIAGGDIDLGGNFAEHSGESIDEAAEELADMLSDGVDWFDDAKDIYEEALELQLDVLDEDPEDRADVVEEMTELFEDLESEIEDATETERQLWDFYSELKAWGYHFSESGSPEDLFDMEFEMAGFDYSEDAFAQFASELSARVETFAIENDNGAQLESLDVPSVD